MEVSLLISCRVPTYLMSDLEMSEMRDLGWAEVLASLLACLLTWAVRGDSPYVFRHLARPLGRDGEERWEGWRSEWWV